jgi:5'-3' exonuclease
MGIPSYFSYIVKNHKQIIQKYNKELIIVNNLYMDCNSIIYDVIHSTANELLTNKYIIKHVIQKIEGYIATIEPNMLVFIAFDGVAPVAKLEQQRSRRYKSMGSTFEKSGAKSNPHKPPLSADSKPNVASEVCPHKWDTTAITPGTEFMKELNQDISDYFMSTFKKSGAKSIESFPQMGDISGPESGDIGSACQPHYIVSTSNEIGEGEHKIFEHIRNNPLAYEETSVVYGLDADLIMLAINHLPIQPNIYLFRETPEFIKSIDNSLEPNESYLLDIPLLVKTMGSDSAYKSLHKPSTKSNSNSFLEKVQEKEDIKGAMVCLAKINPHDYIFICFFLGNDFMPHFPALNIRTGGIDKLLNAYKATMTENECLTDGKKIFWKNVRKFVQYLANLEEDYIKNEMKGRDKREKYAKIAPEETEEQRAQKIESIPTWERDTEKYINPFKEGWQHRYYLSLFKLTIDDERRKQIANNYMQGLEWTMKYYTSGCPDWRWKYQHNYPPLLQDLVKYIPYFDTEFISPKQLENCAVTEIEQLCYVLPQQSLHLLPKEVYEEIKREKMHLYPTDADYVWAFCRYFWESHVELPDMPVHF